MLNKNTVLIGTSAKFSLKYQRTRFYMHIKPSDIWEISNVLIGAYCEKNTGLFRF